MSDYSERFDDVVSEFWDNYSTETTVEVIKKANLVYNEDNTIADEKIIPELSKGGKTVIPFEFNKYGDKIVNGVIKNGESYASYMVTYKNTKNIVQLYSYKAGGYGIRIEARVSEPQHWRNASLMSTSFSNVDEAIKHINKYWDNFSKETKTTSKTKTPKKETKTPGKSKTPKKESAKQFPQLEDNYRQPLSNFSNTLYHEGNVDDAIKFIDRNYMLDTNYSDIFFSNDRDLAIGQGDNKGIIIEIKPNENIYGIVSRRKPTWEYLYQQGKAEFIGTANIQRDYQDSVVSITTKFKRR